MSSLDILVRVNELEHKASELSKADDFLGAAKYYGLAADAARALGKDNLVLVDMINGQATALFAGTRLDKSHKRYNENLALCSKLISDDIASLERRRVAGTLLEGKCAALEEAWFAGDLHRRVEGLAGSEAVNQATLVGYEQFLIVAANVATLVIAGLRSTLVSASAYSPFCSAHCASCKADAAASASK